MTDPALTSVNKKTWNQTKPIMICSVLSFLSSLLVLVYFLFEVSIVWFWLPFCSNLICICLSVHHAWLLEEKL